MSENPYESPRAAAVEQIRLHDKAGSPRKRIILLGLVIAPPFAAATYYGLLGIGQLLGFEVRFPNMRGIPDEVTVAYACAFFSSPIFMTLRGLNRLTPKVTLIVAACIAAPGSAFAGWVACSFVGISRSTIPGCIAFSGLQFLTIMAPCAVFAWWLHWNRPPTDMGLTQRRGRGGNGGE